MITLFESGQHRNAFYNDLSSGHMVQANQHIIVEGDEGIILDPGGHKIQSKLFSMIAEVLPISNLKHILFSHQDPDIVAAANAWLMVTDAKAYLSAIWMRFVPHFGIDELVVERIQEIPDEGMSIAVGGKPLRIIPAHYLHSCGNFHVYDPLSKIYYTGDLGASMGQEYTTVEDFSAHVKYMEGFHKRFMPSSRALRMWAKTARSLDIEVLAPQHGAIMRGKELVSQFIEWVEKLETGLDLMGDSYPVPA